MTTKEEEEPRGDLPTYYRKLNDSSLNAFQNFDDLSNFKSLDNKVRLTRTRNFIIDFGDDEAWCAFDLDAEPVNKLLKAPVRLPKLFTAPCR